MRIENAETIEEIAPGRLKPWTRNARTHSKKQLRQIAESIQTFGFTNPVLIDEEERILAGHGRQAPGTRDRALPPDRQHDGRTEAGLCHRRQ